ncbi:MAG: helix-turn-helix transcriptional regulator [Vicinamibacterales bacterium]
MLKTYRELVGAVGTDRLGGALLQAFNAALPVDELFGFERQFANKHRCLITAGEAKPVARRLGAQHHRFRVFDPLTRMIDRSEGPEILAMKLRAEHIGNPLYRRECYERFSYDERISLATRHEAGWCVLNLYRHSGRRTASDDAIDELQELAQLALPLVIRHVELVQDAAGASGGGSVERIAARLAALFPQLAAREREVCAYTLTGASAREIGEKLGIAATSVLTYRRRAYEKLDISSAAQLTGALIG